MVQKMRMDDAVALRKGDGVSPSFGVCKNGKEMYVFFFWSSTLKERRQFFFREAG